MDRLPKGEVDGKNWSEFLEFCVKEPCGNSVINLMKRR